MTIRKPAPVPPPPEGKARALEERWGARESLPAGTAQTSKRSDVESTGDRRLVARKGRLLADGSRTEAPARLRLTVYLPPELGRALDVAAASTGRERSSIIGEALAAWLEREGK